MTTPVDTRGLVQRAEVLAQLRQVLAARHRLVLCGPAGVGKSVLLDQLLGPGPDGVLLRAYPMERSSPYAVLAGLFSTVNEAVQEALAVPRRRALAQLLRREQPVGTDLDPVALQMGLRDVVERLAEAGPVWLVVDPAERADAASLDALAQLLRQVPPDRLRAVVASRQPGLSHRLGLPGDQELGVPVWAMGEVAELLAPLRLSGRTVVRVHRASGGLPDLALRIGVNLRGLDRIDQRNRPLDDSYTYPDSAGDGVTVYVIDTGIRATHRDFGGRASGGPDFITPGGGSRD